MSRVAVVLAAVLVLAACGDDPAPPSTPAAPPSAAVTSAPASPSATGAASDTPEALRFTAKTVDGAQFDAATLAGKPAVLWFWAAWCPRCAGAADDVAGVQRDFAGRVTVVGVAGLESGEDAMRDFVADFKIGGFVNLADDEGAVWRRFGVTTQEYYVVLDKAGTVVHKGPLTPDALRDRVTALAG